MSNRLAIDHLADSHCAALQRCDRAALACSDLRCESRLDGKAGGQMEGFLGLAHTGWFAYDSTRWPLARLGADGCERLLMAGTSRRQPQSRRRKPVVQLLAEAMTGRADRPTGNGREEPHTEPGRPTAAVHIAVGERRRTGVSSAAALQLSAARTDCRPIAAVHGSFLHDCKGKKAEVHGGWQQAAPQRSTRASLHCGVQPGSAACATCIQRTSYWLRSIGACQPAATRDLSRARLAQTGPLPVSMR